jgi:glutathione S-transferase
MKLLGSPGSPYVRKIRIVLLEKRIPCDFQHIDLLDPNSELSRANPNLIPEDLEERAEVKRWEAVADGIMDATVAISHDYVLSDVEGGGLAWSNANQQRKIDLGLSVMERDLGTREYCHGNAFTLADIACVVALAYLDHVLLAVEWRTAHPNLGRLSERVEARDSCEATRHKPA